MPRGRKPIPPEIKRKKGDGVHDTGGRVIPTDTAKPVAEKPHRPDHLSHAGAAAWDDLVKKLEELGVLTATDAAAITLCAELMGIARDAYNAIKSDGAVVRVNNQPVTHLQVAVYNKAVAQIRPLLVEFGLTPSARSRVKGPKDEKDPSDFSDL